MDFAIQADEIVSGGTGYAITLQNGKEVYRSLLDRALPLEIEHQYPDYTRYPKMTQDTAYGFLTRGCPRNCGFCHVTCKEGPVSLHVADLDEFWNGQKKIKLLDPNLLAAKGRERLLSQLVESRAYVDFTQGLDIRMVRDVTGLLDRVKIERVHFAWDNPEEDLVPHFRYYAETARPNKHRPPAVYVLTNYSSTHEQDLYRIYTLRDLGFEPYVMIYDKAHAPRETRLLQRWVNNRIIFNAVKRFEDYDCKVG